MKPSDLKPGEGGVIKVGNDELAVYNDDNGQVKAASAVCTHLGCAVEWNAGEKTFDCPCHGSRFGTDFSVKQGPAKRPLEPRDLPNP